MLEKPIKVAIWPTGGFTTASSRYRILELLPYFDSNKVVPTLLAGGKTTVVKAVRALKVVSQSDCLLIQKKLFPPLYLSLLRRISKSIVYDVDDALYTQRRDPSPAEYRAGLKQKIRFKAMVEQADVVVCGNRHLSARLSRDGVRTEVIPTGYYVNRLPEKVHEEKTPVVIGWVGSRGTMVYLDLIAPLIKEIEAEGNNIKLHVISDKPYHYSGLEHVIESTKWSVETEWDSILQFDVGVMPLYDEEWSRGKCAFKAIQMMAFGLPVIASAVGANRELIDHGVNGLLASNTREWKDAIETLYRSADLRRVLGMKGRETVRQHYSLRGSATSLQALIFRVCSQP